MKMITTKTNSHVHSASSCCLRVTRASLYAVSVNLHALLFSSTSFDIFLHPSEQPLAIYRFCHAIFAKAIPKAHADPRCLERSRSFGASHNSTIPIRRDDDVGVEHQPV